MGDLAGGRGQQVVADEQRDSLQRLRWVILMAIGSVAYASLHLIREWQKYGGMAAGYRPGWVVGDPNYYSISALLCIPMRRAIIAAGNTPPRVL